MYERPPTRSRTLRRFSSSATVILSNGLAALVELDENHEDRFVDVRVEIVRPNDLTDGGEHLAVDEHRSDQRHLGLEIVRRYAVDRRMNRCNGHARAAVRRCAGERLVGRLCITKKLHTTVPYVVAQCSGQRRRFLGKSRSTCATLVAGTISKPPSAASVSRKFSLGTSTRRMPACRAAYSFS